MNKALYIGDLELNIAASCVLKIAPEIDQFLMPVTTINRCVFYEIRFGKPQPIPFQVSAQLDLPMQLIGKIDGLEARFYPDFFTGEPLAMYKEIDKNHVQITLYREAVENLEISLELLNYFALERQLIQNDCMILHSSFIVHEGQAILFTAPSGTGKSTQAELWEKYAGATIMNGDRTLLVKSDAGWKAVGFPFSGSSGINHNGAYPIKAIVMIHQAKENVVATPPLSVRFKRTYPEIVRNYWDMEFESKVMDLLEDILGCVPCVSLGCDISEGAVKCLREYLSV